MKKNKMMRLASFLLVAVLLTTSVISGTYAKYVTTASGNDTARVANWGVEITADEDIFLSEYAPHDDEDGFGYGEEFSVAAASEDEDDHVVAPGTNGAFTFSITGAPEVAVNVAVSFSGNPDTTDDDLQMIKVAKDTVIGKNSDGTDLKASGDYYPIKWTLKRSNTQPTNWDAVAAITDLNGVTLDGVTLADIEAYFGDEDDGISGNYDPNDNLAEKFGYYQLSWEWTYYVDAATDMLDTYLGNHTTDQNESFNLSITVTQID